MAAAAEAWTCPVCREARRDVAYATPCNHQFCLGCIQRWAILKSSCPLCRTQLYKGLFSRSTGPSSSSAGPANAACYLTAQEDTYILNLLP
uniref:RING-type domain-containing protein n=1 Tax=Phasianus colchicus TaxID=9054 RepID=A0A669PC16_PHACC